MRRRKIFAVAVVAALSGLSTSAVAAPAPGAPSASQVRAGEWWLSEMGIEKAWSVTKGKGVTVGLLDSGVDATHPDLQGALVPGSDISGHGAANGERPVDDDAHGTEMAGYIVGRGHDGQGLLGVAPEAKLMSVSQANVTGEQSGKGLRYLVDHGAKVVNMSFSGDLPNASDIAYAESHDVVLVASTGNGAGTPPENPSTQFGVVSVSGVLKDMKKTASGASYGPPQIDRGATSTTGQLQGTAVAGPFDNTDGAQSLVSLTTVADGTYARGDGTSGAAAIVSGIVALIRAAHPGMDAANVINRLIRTASLLKQGKVSENIGFGVPDAYAAVTSTSIKTVCENPLGSQVTKSLGFWPSVLDGNIVYKQKCATKPSSSVPPSSTSASSSGTSSTGASSSGAAAPASSAPSQAAASTGGGSSGGVPVWVYVLIAVIVLAAIALVVVLRSRGKRGGPGGPPPGGPYGGPPPGGGYGPPPGGPYGGPPQCRFMTSHRGPGLGRARLSVRSISAGRSAYGLAHCRNTGRRTTALHCRGAKHAGSSLATVALP